MRDANETVVVWFRDDLRVADNPALRAAVEGGRPVVALFVLDEESPGIRPLGGAARWWLHHSLESLAASLGGIGVPLVLRSGPAAAEVRAVVEALDAGAGTPRGDDPEDDDDVAVAAAAELDDLCDVRPARAGEPGRFRAFARAATTSALAPEPPGSRAAATALGALCDIPGLFERALDAAPDQLDTGTTAALLLCLSRPPLRDVALSQWSFSIAVGAEVLEAQVLWHDGEAFPARLATHMVGEGPSPDLARVRAALALVRHLSAVAPAQWRCAPLTVAAWLSWALGRSTHASDFLALALEIDPGYGLAEIVSTMVRSGHLPEWAFGRSDTLRAPGLDRETGGSRGAT